MLLIKNCSLWTMADRNDVPGDILVDGGIIRAVGDVEVPEGSDLTVLDAAGAFVMPGIVDPHCHIGIMQSTIGKMGNDTNESTSPITPNLRGFDGVKAFDDAFPRALQTGVTTVCTGPGSANIIGGTFCALKTCGKTAEDMCMVEELCMKMALGENPRRVYEKSGPSTRMASAAVLRDALTQAKLYKEEWDTYEARLQQGQEAKRPAYNARWHSLKRIWEGMPVKIHAHQEDDILTACRISREFGIHSTIDHCTSGWHIPEKLAEYGKMVILGPTLGEKSKYELKDKSFEAARVMYEHGIPFAIMTDHPVVPLEHTRTQTALFVAHGLPYLEGLRAITLYAARAVGLDGRIGSLEPGKEADIVLYDGDPLHYMTKVKTVLIGGRTVYQA